MKNQNNELNNPAITAMLQLLAAALNQCEMPFDFDVLLWPEMKKELEAQAVLPLVSDVLMNTDISKEEKMELIKITTSNVKTFHKLMSAQTTVITLLNSQNISAVIMKGAAAAQYYTRPELRQYGDVDILVMPDDYKKAFELLRTSGYKNLQEYDVSNKRHIGFVTPEKMEVELHRYFSSSLNMDQNDFFDCCLFDKLNKAVYIQLSGYIVPVFPSLENGLLILGHINQHLCEGLGLRQIIDWMLYVRAELTDNFWRDNFLSRAQTIGMDYLAKAVTKMCQKYLGLSKEFTWCQDVDDDLIDELMLYIISKGNFGVKIDKNSGYTIFVAHKFTNPIQFFSYLTEGGIFHMTQAGLKPRKAYAWLYQIGHLLRMTFNQKKMGNLSKEIQSGVQEADLLKRLKVTRI